MLSNEGVVSDGVWVFYVVKYEVEVVHVGVNDVLERLCQYNVVQCSGNVFCGGGVDWHI